MGWQRNSVVQGPASWVQGPTAVGVQANPAGQLFPEQTSSQRVSFGSLSIATQAWVDVQSGEPPSSRPTHLVNPPPASGTQCWPEDEQPATAALKERAISSAGSEGDAGNEGRRKTTSTQAS